MSKKIIAGMLFLILAAAGIYFWRVQNVRARAEKIEAEIV